MLGTKSRIHGSSELLPPVWRLCFAVIHRLYSSMAWWLAEKREKPRLFCQSMQAAHQCMPAFKAIDMAMAPKRQQISNYLVFKAANSGFLMVCLGSKSLTSISVQFPSAYSLFLQELRPADGASTELQELRMLAQLLQRDRWRNKALRERTWHGTGPNRTPEMLETNYRLSHVVVSRFASEKWILEQQHKWNSCEFFNILQ